MKGRPALEVSQPVLSVHGPSEGDDVHVADMTKSYLHALPGPRLVPRSLRQYAERSVSIDAVLHGLQVCNHSPNARSAAPGTSLLRAPKPSITKVPMIVLQSCGTVIPGPSLACWTEI